MRVYNALLLTVLLLAPSTAFAHAVTMNFRFALEDSGDLIHANETDYTTPHGIVFRDLNKKYVSAERGNSIAILAFAGQSFLSLSFDNFLSPYLFSITQDEQEARFLIGLTRGTWQGTDVAASQGKLPPRTLAGLPPPAEFSRALSLQLHVTNAMLSGSLSSGRILIKYAGKQRLHVVNVSVIG